MIRAQEAPLVIEEVTDPEELARARARRALFDRNWCWFSAHATAIYEAHRGKHICITNQELFAADSAREALASATAAHPEDEGRFLLYIPRERATRVYAHSRLLAFLS